MWDPTLMFKTLAPQDAKRAGEIAWGAGGSRDPYLGRRATRPDYPAYVRWCQARGIPPLSAEPLAYGDVK
jgi:hypothetical protein